MTASVIQEWLSTCSFKQQVVVLSALRGCDGIPKEDGSKALTRAFRSAILKPAESINPENSFMWRDPKLEDKATYFVSHTDHYPVHWVLHFAHACEIVAYKHPERSTANFWANIYIGICEAFHMHAESEKACDFRLRDNSLAEGEDQ